MPKSESDPTYRRPDAVLETVLYCADLESARTFYEDVIGLELVSSEPGRHHFFCIGLQMLLLFQPDTTATAQVRIGRQLIPQHGAKGPGHIAFQLDDDQIESTRRHLLRHGCTIESEIDWPGGGHSIYLRDPAGNSVEFATRDLWFDAEDAK